MTVRKCAGIYDKKSCATTHNKTSLLRVRNRHTDEIKFSILTHRQFNITFLLELN